MNDALSDMGQPRTLSDGWIVLNPASTFPLGIYGVSFTAACDIKNGLVLCLSNPREAEEIVFPIVATSSEFRWRELEIYQRDFTAPFVAALRDMERRSPDFQQLVAGGDDTEDERDRMRCQMHIKLVKQWGEAFRYADSVVSQDRHERIGAITELLVLTYRDTGNATDEREQHFLPDLLADVTGWIFNRPPGGCCHVCRSRPKETGYLQYPNVPVHVDCLCSVEPKFR